MPYYCYIKYSKYDRFFVNSFVIVPWAFLLIKCTFTHVPSFMGLYSLFIVASNVPVKAAHFFCSKLSAWIPGCLWWCEHGVNIEWSNRAEKCLPSQYRMQLLQPHQDHQIPDLENLKFGPGLWQLFCHVISRMWCGPKI